MTLTDPPYNVNYQGGTKEKLKIENDNMSDSDFFNFLTSAFKGIEYVLKKGGVFYIWYASREVLNFMGSLKNVGLEVRQNLIWNKNVFILGRQDYHWKHEPCLYGWKDGAAHYFINDRTQSTVFEGNEIEIEKLSKKDAVELLKEILRDVQGDVINEDKPLANRLHPTMKPIKLLAKQIINSTIENGIVYDPFLGSGSTLISCEQTNRICYGFELSPNYCDVILSRWEALTGGKAVKLNE